MSFEKNLEELAKKLKVGQHLYVVDRLNKNDQNTVTITDPKFDDEIKNQKNWPELIRSIYSNVAEFKSRKFVVSKDPKNKNTFNVNEISKKEVTTSKIVKVLIKNNTIIIHDLKNRDETKIELIHIVESNKESETGKDFYLSVIDALKKTKPSSPKQTMELIQQLIKNK